MPWQIYITLIGLILLIDLYVFQGVKTLIRSLQRRTRRIINGLFWGISIYFILAFSFYKLAGPSMISSGVQRWTAVFFFIIYVSKLPTMLFLLADDFIRLVKWLMHRQVAKRSQSESKQISRSQFLAKISMITATVPVATLGFGIVSGAYDYRLRKKNVIIKNLPKAFDGIRIGQLSDIHSGSFFNKTAVQKGIDMMQNEKPDIFVFTGDLVNNETSEVKEYKSMFGKLHAPLGAFSTTGNHDYGDYRRWPSVAAKKKNFEDLKLVHKEMGWDLLMNEHRILKVDGDELAILGIENWGTGRFSKYGNLAKAYLHTDEIPAKVLLSHDPSHWDAQVRPSYPNIDLTLAGHTHGFQFGIEIGNFKWSPSQYAYTQWADLYQEGDQQLYVNRGFGFIGYPGRVGILPEVTILELVRA